MSTVLVGDRPPEVEELIQRRRALGQDLFDEVWEGDYHLVPVPHRQHGELDEELAYALHPRAKRAGLRGSGPCNIGEPNDYRVPDGAYFADRHPQVFNPSAEIVLEIVSPGDESRRKFDFYFRAGVKEVLIVDPTARTVEWFVRGGSDFHPAVASSLLGISATELFEQIDWP
jgi:Uma2 family endonuclease